MRVLSPVLLLIFAVAHVSHAQEPIHPTLYIGAGMTQARGDDARYSDTGFHLASSLGRSLTDRLAFHAGAGIHYLPMNPDDLSEAFGLDRHGYSELEGGDFIAITAMADVRYFPLDDSRLNPYVLAGLGLVHTRRGDLDFEYFGVPETYPAAANSRFGINFGGGAHYPVTSTVSVFGQTAYTIAFTDDESVRMLPLQIGLFIDLVGF